MGTVVLGGPLDLDRGTERWDRKYVFKALRAESQRYTLRKQILILN